MTNISYKIGTYKEYTLNGTQTIRVNVSDFGIIDRLYAAMAKCDELRAKYQELTPDNISEIDKELREMIDKALDCPGASDKAFGTTHCLTIADGQPILINFLTALVEQLKKDILSVKAASSVNESIKANNSLASLENERTQKYLKPITVVPKTENINIAALSQPERERLLRELLGDDE